MHAEITQVQRMVVGHRPFTHQGCRHRDTQAFDKSTKVIRAFPGDDAAAAGQKQRLPAGTDRLIDLLRHTLCPDAGGPVPDIRRRFAGLDLDRA